MVLVYICRFRFFFCALLNFLCLLYFFDKYLIYSLFFQLFFCLSLSLYKSLALLLFHFSISLSLSLSKIPQRFLAFYSSKFKKFSFFFLLSPFVPSLTCLFSVVSIPFPYLILNHNSNNSKNNNNNKNN